MNRHQNLAGLLIASGLALAGPAPAASVTTGVDAANSAMGATAHGCLQRLTITVGEGENCMYDGGPSGIELSPGSGIFLAPFGESTGPFSQLQYYDYSTTPESFDNVVLAQGDPNKFASAPSDGKIRPVISGSIAIDDNGDGFGANDLVSFTLTMSSPNGGDIVRNLGDDLADRYTSMTQTLAATQVNSAIGPNAFGGLDYVIGSEGFPVLLTFTDATANGGACVGQTFGDMECSASFGGNMNGDPLRWTPWVPTDSSTIEPPPAPHQGPPASAGIGSLEDNIGPRTMGSIENPFCNQETGTDSCTTSRVSFAPREIGPNNAPGPNNVTAEDVDWDHVYLLVSTDADGNVVSAEGFYVQEYQVFGNDAACGNDAGALEVCNSWLAGHFTIAGAAATDDTADADVDTPVTIDILANDSGFADDVTVSLPGGGTTVNGGTVVINGANPGPQASIDVTYTPATGFSGTDTFDYVLSDGTTTSRATVTIKVGSIDDDATTRLNTQVTIPVGANDTGFCRSRYSRDCTAARCGRYDRRDQWQPWSGSRRHDRLHTVRSTRHADLHRDVRLRADRCRDGVAGRGCHRYSQQRGTECHRRGCRRR